LKQFLRIREKTPREGERSIFPSLTDANYFLKRHLCTFFNHCRHLFLIIFNAKKLCFYLLTRLIRANSITKRKIIFEKCKKKARRDCDGAINLKILAAFAVNQVIFLLSRP
jgi:hypothetical protein